MPFSITTKDGITINNIPDDIDPNSDVLRRRVAGIRSQGGDQPLAHQPDSVLPSEISKQRSQNGSVNQPIPDNRLNVLGGSVPIPADNGEISESKRLRDEAVAALPELGVSGQSVLPKDAGAGDLLKIAGSQIVTTSPIEMANIVKAQFPDTVDISQTRISDGTIIPVITNRKTGRQAVLNQPNLSGIDIIQGLGLMAAFTPATKAASLGGGLLAKLVVGGVAAGATQAGIEQGQESLGGEFDGGDVALSAGFGAGGELIAPVARGVKQAVKPVTAAIGKQAASALEKGKVLTSDIIKPDTLVTKMFQKISERIPLLGTGKVRARQQLNRKQILADLASENDIDLNSEFEKQIVDSADEFFEAAKTKAGAFRTAATDELIKLGDVPTPNTLKSIDRIIEKQRSLGDIGDQAAIDAVEKFRNELSGNFDRLREIRTVMFDTLGDFKQAGSTSKSSEQKAIKKISNMLSKDLDEFAIAAGKREGASPALKQAANKWKASNRIFKEGFEKAKETELKRVFEKGTITPEIINTTLKGGKISQLKRLNANITPDGRAATRKQILKNIFEDSKSFDEVNPNIFVSAIKKPKNQRALNIFFKGSDKRAIDGLTEFLDITRRAQDSAASIASQGEVLLGATGVAGAAGFIDPAIATIVGSAGLTSRALESKPIRNLLIKLTNTKPLSKTSNKIIDQLKPMILALQSKTRQSDG